MKVVGRVATAAAAIILTGGFASAADMMAADYVDTAAPALTGFYGSLHAGYFMPQDPSVSFAAGGGTVSGEANLSDGYRVGGAVGYDFNRNIAAELEVSSVRSDVDSISLGAPVNDTLSVDGTGSQLTLMGNVLFGEHFGRWRPYVGAGVGASRVSLDVDLFSGVDDSDWAFAAQAIAGVDYDLTDTVSLGARYRYLHTGSTDFSDGDGDPVTVDDFGLHSVEAVLKIRFGN